MLLNQHRTAIGTFPSPETAGQAFDQLVLAGFPISKLFLLYLTERAIDPSQDATHSSVDYAQVNAITGTPLGLKKGFVLGNLLGSASGLLIGAGILALPGVGQIAAGSAIVLTLVSGGICTAAGGLIGSMIGLGLTAEQAKAFSRRIAQGNVLLVVEGTKAEILRARDILSTQGIQKEP